MPVTNRYQDMPIKARFLDADGLPTPIWRGWFQRLLRGLRVIDAEGPLDPPSINAGARAVATFAVTGVRPGDFVAASFVPPNAAVSVFGQVTADNVVTVTFLNLGSSPVDLPVGTLRVRVESANV